MAERVGFEPNSKRNFNELRGQVRVRKYGTESYDIAIAPLLLPQRTQVLGSIPEWHGWHAARRGLGSNLYRIGVPDMVIQRILRHANVSTTATYYIKTAADDVRKAMTRLENHMSESSLTQSDTNGTLESNLPVEPSPVQ